MSETPREFYLRAVVKMGNLEVIMGLEFNPDPVAENAEWLRDDMKSLAIAEVGALRVDDDITQFDGRLASKISAAMGKRWPGRRYFLEVQHDDPDEGWVQVITPAGWPPRKEGA